MWLLSLQCTIYTDHFSQMYSCSQKFVNTVNVFETVTTISHLLRNNSNFHNNATTTLENTLSKFRMINDDDDDDDDDEYFRWILFSFKQAPHILCVHNHS